jgi:AcrR family transcriptional regulator
MLPRHTINIQTLKKDRRSQIMDVAMEHFASQGYHNTTVTHIARHAKISKGLLYLYFDSKEQLLFKIVERSLNQISEYLDPDKDGFLTEQEFELFVRKFFHVLREKRTFWQLFFQMILQKEVRDQLFSYFIFPVVPEDTMYPENRISLPLEVSKMVPEYFKRKKKRKPEGYDHILDMKMFIYTMEGFAMISAFLENADNEYYEKAIDKIIEQYK